MNRFTQMWRYVQSKELSEKDLAHWIHKLSPPKNKDVVFFEFTYNDENLLSAMRYMYVEAYRKKNTSYNEKSTT